MTDQTTSSFHLIRRPLLTITGLYAGIPGKVADSGKLAVASSRRNGMERETMTALYRRKPIVIGLCSMWNMGDLWRDVQFSTAIRQTINPYATIHADK